MRYAVLGGTGKPSVLVVTASGDLSRDAFYVQHALAGRHRGRCGVSGRRASAAAQLASWTEDRLRPHAAVLLLSTRGLERRGRELLAAYAQHGGGIFIAAGPDVDGDVVGDVLGAGSTLRIADGRRRASRRPRARWRRPTCAIRCFSVCGESGDLGPGDVSATRRASAASAARRWRGSRPATRR